MSRTVFSIDTEHDKNLLALARTACQCSISSCRGTQCNTCNTYNSWKYCYNDLAECDKLRVANMTQDLIAQVKCVDTLIHYRQSSGFIHGVRVSIRKIIMVLTIIMFSMSAVSVLFMLMACSRPSGISIDTKITNIVGQMPRSIPDVNRDGKNDCIDRAISFKILWDSTYDNSCEIVRNYNQSNKLHHLYCRVYDTENKCWVLVEPDVNQKSYKVKEVWGDSYDPACDIYGESFRWMKEVVYGKCNN